MPTLTTTIRSLHGEVKEIHSGIDVKDDSDMCLSFPRMFVSFCSGGNTYDVGMAQVNTINWSSCSGGNPPCDPSTNLGCAIDVWRWGGGTFSLWSTCGGCGACSSTEKSINPEWDGTWPKGYDVSQCLRQEN
jgi:hypothetical protein